MSEDLYLETRRPGPVFATAPDRRIEWLDKVADWLDNRFRIPFTNIRFGLDAVIGLVPYVGDLLSFIISSVLVFMMLRYRISGKVLVLMTGNILIDGVVGSVPLLGDLFDLRYRANRRNLLLLRTHLNKGHHGGSGWWIVLLFFLLLFGAFFLLAYGLWRLLAWVF